MASMEETSAAAAKSGRAVVIAIDGSKQAEQAFDWYATSVHRKENKVILVHSPECSTVTVARAHHEKLNQGMIGDMLAKEKKETEGIISKYTDKLNQYADIVNHEFKTAYGDKPGEAIITSSADVAADMIIMGTRGLGTIRRTIMGSVSDYVVHHAHCPVIVYRH